MHGGATHFPIVLTLAALACAAAARAIRDDSRRREWHRGGLWALWLAALGSVTAAGSGLILSKWAAIGSGALMRHHLFVWPGSIVLVGLAIWRLRSPVLGTGRREAIYLTLLALAALCMLIGGFFGGELLLMNQEQ
jgi:uncharacterized membrane protein